MKLTRAQEALLRRHNSIYRWRKWYGNPPEEASELLSLGLLEVTDDEGGGSVMFTALTKSGRAYLATHPEPAGEETT